MDKKKKLIITSGSNHTIPLVQNSPGVARIIFNISNKIDPSFEIVVISRFHPELSEMEFDRTTYLHVKSNWVSKVLETLIGFIPYSIRKKLFGVTPPNRIVYFINILYKVRKNKPDIVVTFMHFELFKLLREFTPKAKHIFFYRSSGIRDRIGEKNLNYLISKSSGILANTREPIEFIRNFYPNLKLPLETIYNAIDFSLFSKKEDTCNILKNKPLTIGYAGRLTKEKNIHLLLNTIFQLKKEGKIINVHLAGSPAVEKSPDWKYYDLLRRFADINLPGQIHFLGWIPNYELGDFYSNIDIGVLLSDKREGNSMFILECMAMGKPIISTDIGGNSEIINNGYNGYKISNSNIEIELIETITKLENNRNILAKLGENAFKYVQDEHSYEKLINKFNSFLNNFK